MNKTKNKCGQCGESLAPDHVCNAYMNGIGHELNKMKCVVCHSKATYIMSGNSLCTHCAEEHQLGYGKDLLTIMSEKGYFDGKLEKYKPQTTFMSEKNYDIYMQLLGNYDQTRKLKIDKMTK